VVNTRLSGSFNGEIYFIGKPEFNALDNTIEVRDLDFHVDTRNTLLRSASWLFKGTIKKKMASAMSFPLADNIGAVGVVDKFMSHDLEEYVLATMMALKNKDAGTAEYTKSRWVVKSDVLLSVGMSASAEMAEAAATIVAWVQKKIEKAGNEKATFALFFKLELWCEKFATLVFGTLRSFSTGRFEFGLPIKSIEMAGATLHEQEDDSFCFCFKMRCSRSEWRCGLI
jgi:hypothetical protein